MELGRLAVSSLIGLGSLLAGCAAPPSTTAQRQQFEYEEAQHKCRAMAEIKQQVNSKVGFTHQQATVSAGINPEAYAFCMEKSGFKASATGAPAGVGTAAK